MKNYSHFYQIITTAQNKFKVSGSLETQLISAIIELNHLHESEVPDYKWGQIQEIIKLSNVHKQIGDEGDITATINKITHNEKTHLMKLIQSL